MKKHGLLIVLFKDLANGYLVFGRGVALVREDLREGAERRLVEGKGRGARGSRALTAPRDCGLSEQLFQQQLAQLMFVCPYHHYDDMFHSKYQLKHLPIRYILYV